MATPHVELQKRNGNRTVEAFDAPAIHPDDLGAFADLLRRKATELGWNAGDLQLVVYGGSRVHKIQV